ncbi:MAG: recombinase family protein [Oscillospiraceae bacterium]
MRIAVYSRKSKFTGKGESIENQVLLCREYIRRNIPEAAEGDITVYEDEGFSAKNLDRPQFRQMMKTARRQPFDYIVVYRLDRISRNVGDFTGLIEELGEMNTAFICIKEQFDTSTPMGRAMMNIAAVFAQLERETIAERVRDNLVLLARTGRWLGGVTPLGFTGERVDIRDGEGKKRSAYRLSEVGGEMRTVRILFDKFLELCSLTKTAQWCIKNGIRTRGGAEMRPRTVRDILTNPVYCTADGAAYDYFAALGSDVCFDRSEADGKHGLMPFGRTSQSGRRHLRLPVGEWLISVGRHRGVIPSEEWIKVQEMIRENAGKSFYRPSRNRTAVLSGLVRCGKCGSIMRPRVNSGRRLPDGTPIFYYMCEYKERSRRSGCDIPNVSGNSLDRLVCDKITGMFPPDAGAAKYLRKLTARRENECGDSGRTVTPEKAIAEKRRMISRLLAALAASEDSAALVAHTRREIERLDGEIRAIEAELNAPAAVTGDLPQEMPQELSGESGEWFAALSAEERRAFIRRVISRVEWDGGRARVFLRGE